MTRLAGLVEFKGTSEGILLPDPGKTTTESSQVSFGGFLAAIEVPEPVSGASKLAAKLQVNFSEGQVMQKEHGVAGPSGGHPGRAWQEGIRGDHLIRALPDNSGKTIGPSVIGLSGQENGDRSSTLQRRTEVEMHDKVLLDEHPVKLGRGNTTSVTEGERVDSLKGQPRSGGSNNARKSSSRGEPARSQSRVLAKPPTEVGTNDRVLGDQHPAKLNRTLAGSAQGRQPADSLKGRSRSGGSNNAREPSSKGELETRQSKLLANQISKNPGAAARALTTAQNEADRVVGEQFRDMRKAPGKASAIEKTGASDLAKSAALPKRASMGITGGEFRAQAKHISKPIDHGSLENSGKYQRMVRSRPSGAQFELNRRNNGSDHVLSHRGKRASFKNSLSGSGIRRGRLARAPIANLSGVPSTPASQFSPPANILAGISHLLMVEKITQVIYLAATTQTTQASFVVDGGCLGSFSIQFIQDAMGNQVTIVVGSEDARNALLKYLPTINENLSAKGIAISSLEVQVGGFDRPGAQFKEGKRYFQQALPPRRQVAVEDTNPAIAAVRDYGYNTIDVLA